MVTLDQCGWLGDRARIYAPSADVSEWVEHVFELDMRAASTESWLIMPDPCAHLIVHVHDHADARRISTSTVGPRTSAIQIDVRGRSWTVGVRLRPGALFALAGLEGAELTDTSVAPGALWGSQGTRLESRISSAFDPIEIGRILSHWVRDLGRSRPERPWTARSFERALAVSRSGKVEEVAALMGLSPRTLRKHSVVSTGLTPKRHARIRRVYQAAEAARARPETNWARIAVATGFVDQSHLSREFSALVGEPPGRFRRRAGHGADSYNP